MTGIQPVILCGGSGSRLWPASRSMYPKQLLPLTGERSMLQETIARLDGIPGIGKPHVVCNEAHRFLVAGQLSEIDAGASIILEPEGRNTAPAIALAALQLLADSDEAGASQVMLVLPADHVIRDLDAFRAVVETGLAAAQEGSLVTFGIVPGVPHTGYGYIETTGGEVVPAAVRSFTEKPDEATASAYLERGNYLWNSGMFMFRVDRIIEELEAFVPDVISACRAALATARRDQDFLRPGHDEFLSSPAESIDYAVMEKTDHGVVVPLDAGWSDVGSWHAIYEIADKDEDGNVIAGDSLAVDTKNTYISSESRLVTAVGVQDLVIVETTDAVLVTSRWRAEEVKQLVEKLQDAGREEPRFHRQVFRPWGSYDSLENDDGFQVKRLVVNPGAVLSLQYHHHRAEHWIVVRGTARITRGEDEFDLTVNESTHIPVGTTHRIANVTDEPVHIIEVQCGDYLGEDDIVRIEDNYGREGTNT